MSNETFIVDDEGNAEREQRSAPADRTRASRDDDRPRRSRSEDRDDDVDAADSGQLSFLDLARRSNRPNMGGLSDAALTTLIETFENAKTYDSPNVPAEVKRNRFEVIPLDANQTGNIPALLVVLPTNVLGQKFSLVYALLFEQPGPLVFKPQEERRGDSFDQLVLTEDYYNKKYRQLISENVTARHKESEVRIVNFQVVLADTVATLTDKDSIGTINRIYDNALDAIANYRDNLLDQKAGKRSADHRINPKMLQKRARLETTFDYSGNGATDSSGLPIRSDITASIFYSSNDDDSDGNPTRLHLGDVRAGVDLVLSADSGSEKRRGWGRGRNRRDERRRDADVEPFYDVVLQVGAILGSAKMPYSLELVQLLLSGFALVTNNFRWVNAIKPRSHIGEGLKPVVDLGALNLLNPEADDAGYMDDLTPNMDDDDLENVLSAMISDEPTIGLTVPSSGEKSGVLAIYEEIALTDDPKVRKFLVDTLFDSADVLFGNYFREAWDEISEPGELPVYATGAKGFTGYWIDPDKQVKRSLGEWNVPAVLSAHKKNPNVAIDYQLTFDDTSRSVEYNLADRYSILQKVVPGLHPTGTSWQLVFNKTYIRALAIAADRSNMASHVTASDTVATRRHVGNSVYRDNAGSDLGVQRRGRDRDDRSTRSSRYTGRNDRGAY